MEGDDYQYRYIKTRMAQGQTPDQISEELTSIGWHAVSARRAIDYFLSGASPKPYGREPGPNLDALPSRLNIDGREVCVQLRIHRPRLCLLGGFLSHDECNQLMDEARPGLKRSRVLVGNGDDGERGVLDYSRTSEQTAFPPGSSGLVDRIRRRVSKLTQWSEDHMESAQVARYRVGADFAQHHDYFCPSAHKEMIEREGQRVATVLVYLNSPDNGGATAFPDIEAEIFPQPGSALIFSYVTSSPNSMTLHAGVPLGRGEKWIATFFLRDRPMVGRNV